MPDEDTKNVDEQDLKEVAGGRDPGAEPFGGAGREPDLPDDQVETPTRQESI